MKQVDHLCKLRYRAILIEPDTTIEAVASEYYNFVLGSPEILVGDPKWRDVIKISSDLSERLRLIVVDEAHTIIHW
jgi:superfamily II DNA helicase RecQ